MTVRAIDERDRAGLGACFTDDTFVDYGSAGSWRGRDQVVNGLLGLVGHLDATQHLITNALVVGHPDDGSVLVRSNLFAQHVLHQAGRLPRLLTGGGYYSDILVRDDMHVAFRSRRYSAVWEAGGPSVMRP